MSVAAQLLLSLEDVLADENTDMHPSDIVPSWSPYKQLSSHQSHPQQLVLKDVQICILLLHTNLFETLDRPAWEHKS